MSSETCIPDVPLFLAASLGKMSQMFSEISSLYLQALINKKCIGAEAGAFVGGRGREKHVQSVSLMIVKELDELGDILSSEQDEKCDLSQEQSIQMEHKSRANKKKKKKSEFKLQRKEQEFIQKPKPPPSSYLLFFKDHKQKIAKQFPNYSVIQLNKIASRCWKQLSEEQKRPYHEKFNEEKQKYYEAIKVYNIVYQSKIDSQRKRSGTKNKDKKLESKKMIKQDRISSEVKMQNKNEVSNEHENHDDESLVI